MLRLFNNIRRNHLATNRLGKYFWYAVGEILLVVVGILIALQVNNWNEERVEARQIKQYVLSLVDDLRNDMEMLEPVGKQISVLIDKSNRMATYVQGKDLDEISNIDLFLFVRASSYRPFAWNRAALDQLKSSGALRQIRNQHLVKMISEYDALTQHLDQDYTNDENNIREAFSFVSGVVNTNYPQRRVIYDYFDDDGDYLKSGFTASDLYREIKANDLPFLTDDINDIRHVANMYIEIGYFLEARVEIEFPRLRTNAFEIIKLIESEYQ